MSSIPQVPLKFRFYISRARRLAEKSVAIYHIDEPAGTNVSKTMNTMLPHSGAFVVDSKPPMGAPKGDAVGKNYPQYWGNIDNARAWHKEKISDFVTRITSARDPIKAAAIVTKDNQQE